ncbi:integrase catalytic domain-containing protein [Trichonephila clavipes]|uniref:Integrase catalytic domain-containing protein n=1 Tax=Trichonephila clavipes TaxID=2585209 RepID=A0A8X6VDB0_TRICX|nr:integrase catalytic domain-containing protein [Trichonephila clavipes]
MFCITVSDVKVLKLKLCQANQPPCLSTEIAFEIMGIDLAGPLFLKSGGKVWIALFTCATFHAIHLELVNSLTADSFLLSLRRFVAIRGRPFTIYSDNGTNFRCASNDLSKLDWYKITRETMTYKILWKFIPPFAAWWGGLWERLVRTVKELLRRTLSKCTLTYEELNTQYYVTGNRSLIVDL